jgi:hypothetical protein
VTGSGSPLEILGSGLFANTSVGAPLIRSTRGIAIRKSTVAANVVLGGESLVLLEHVGDRPVYSHLSAVVLSRNRLLGTGEAPLPSVWPRATAVPAQSQFCLPWGADLLDYRQRELPTVDAASADSVLLRVVGLAAAPSVLAILKSMVVENEMGTGGGLVRTEGELPDFQLSIVHSTIQGIPMIVDGVGGGPGAKLSSARNILIGAPTVSLGAGWGHVEVTMEQAVGNQAGWLAEFAGIPGIIGPSPPPLPTQDLFRDGDEFAGESESSRVFALCPDIDDTDKLGPFGGEGFCGLDQGIHYVPSAAAIAVGSVFWPWEDSLLPSAPPGAPENMPGASGWSCEPGLGPWDQFDAGNGPEGDGDGWTNLVDCAPELSPPPDIPNLPERNGYDTEDCEEIDNDCYQCPPTTPGPDDDDSADDDDSGAETDDDDDDSGHVDGGETELSGCAATGCGVPYRCVDGRPVLALVGVLLAQTPRRRRRGREQR